jgi:hypothetical protein
MLFARVWRGSLSSCVLLAASVLPVRAASEGVPREATVAELREGLEWLGGGRGRTDHTLASCHADGRR